MVVNNISSRFLVTEADYESAKKIDQKVTHEELNYDNPVTVARFNAIKAALEAYTAGKTAHRADIKARLLAAGFTAAEVASVGL